MSVSRRQIKRAIALATLSGDRIVVDRLRVLASLRMVAMPWIPKTARVELRLADDQVIQIPLGEGPTGVWRSQARERYPEGVVYVFPQGLTSPQYELSGSAIGEFLATWDEDTIVDVLHGIERARRRLLELLEQGTRWE